MTVSRNLIKIIMRHAQQGGHQRPIDQLTLGDPLLHFAQIIGRGPAKGLIFDGLTQIAPCQMPCDMTGVPLKQRHQDRIVQRLWPAALTGLHLILQTRDLGCWK